MARFYVGQRVRIKWSYAWPELNGEVGTIVGKAVVNSGPTFGKVGWNVAPDVWGSCESPHDENDIFCPTEDQLEPITDSYDLVSWESMRDLWVPEHLREDA